MRLLALLVAIAGSVVVGSLFVVSAQESTPVPDSAEREDLAPGVTAEEIESPAGPVANFRLIFAPGATYPIDDPRSAVTLFYVEAGSLIVRVEAPVVVSRPRAGGRRDRNVEAGNKFNLRPGDYFIIPPSTVGEVRNDGEEPAAVVIAAITPEEETPALAATPRA